MSVLANLTRDEQREVLQEALRRNKEEERLLDLEKKKLVTGDAVGFYEVVESDGPRPTIELHTPDCRCERFRLPKFMLKGDVLEVGEGDRVPSPQIFRKLSDEEAAEAVTLQATARLRTVEAPVVAAEGALRRTDGEILNAEGIVRVALEKVQALKDEKERANTRLGDAKTAVENFFSGHSAEWRVRLVAETARPDRDASPAPPPEKARAFFPPRADGGKEFTINKATGELERVR
jgi:hypothetical protein